MEQLKYDAQQNWALKWDKANPSNFVKECDASRARQEYALYLKERQERIQRAVTKTITLTNSNFAPVSLVPVSLVPDQSVPVTNITE
jgi:hypothetical protein